jgi:alpha-1,2-mannosyltransferase
LRLDTLVLDALAGVARDGKAIVDGTGLGVGTLFATLDRLETSGLVERRPVELVAVPLPHYQLTGTGHRAQARPKERERAPCVAVPVVLYALVTIWTVVTSGQNVSLSRTDLVVYVGSVRAVQAGVPLYDHVAPSGFPFTYPPFALLAFWPLGGISYATLRVWWVLALCAAATACVVVLARRLRVGRTATCVGGVLLMISAPMESNLKYVQISLVMVLLPLLDGLGVMPPRLRGVLTGLAGAIKLTPLLFVFFFLVTGQRAAAGRAVATFLGGTALAAVLLPSASWTFWTSAVFDPSRTGPVESHLGIGDQSVQATLMRLGLTYGAPETTALVALLGGMVCAVTLAAAAALHRVGRNAEAVVAVGCASLLASPVTWTHHQVWTVFGGLVLLSRPAWWGRAGGASILAVLTLHPTQIPYTPDLLAANGRALCALSYCAWAWSMVWRLRGTDSRYIKMQ